MSSDREKLNCLKRLAQVEQYIHQDKRNPVIVASLLQFIINEPEEEFIASRPEKERGIVDNLKKKTISGEMKWELATILSGGGLSIRNLDCLVYPSEDALQRCEIVKEEFENWDAISDRLYLRDKSGICHYIALTKDDRKFFFAVFEAVKTEKKIGLIDKFSQ